MACLARKTCLVHDRIPGDPTYRRSLKPADGVMDNGGWPTSHRPMVPPWLNMSKPWESIVWREGLGSPVMQPKIMISGERSSPQAYSWA